MNTLLVGVAVLVLLVGVAALATGVTFLLAGNARELESAAKQLKILTSDPEDKEQSK